MAIFEIIPEKIGSQLVSNIGQDDPEEKNDFRVFLHASQNVTGLTEANIRVSAVDSANRAVSGASLVSLDGRNCCYVGVIRPPEVAGLLRVTIAENAVAEGNAETSKDIRMSRSFPDVDAETPTDLFAHNFAVQFRHLTGIAVTPTSIKMSRMSATGADFNIRSFDFSGNLLETQLVPGGSGTGGYGLDYFNGTYLTGGSRVDAHILSRISTGIAGVGATHTRYGILSGDRRTFDGSSQPVYLNTLYPYGDFANPYPFTSASIRIGTRSGTGYYISPYYIGLAAQDDLVYILTGAEGLYQLNSPTEIKLLRGINIESPANLRDVSIYRDTLYFLTDTNVYTLDIRKYRPLRRNTKYTIYPQFFEPNTRHDLRQYSPDAERFIFPVGYDKPPFLSIEGTELVVGANAETCLLKVKPLNRVGW